MRIPQANGPPADALFDDGVLKIVPLASDGTLRVRLAGELDVANVGHVERSLRPMVETHVPVVVDVTELAYCDSQGVRLFFNLGLAAKLHGGSLSMANAHGIVRRVFDITNLADLVDVVDEM